MIEIRPGHSENIEDCLIQIENRREVREIVVDELTLEQNLNYPGRGHVEEEMGGGYSKQRGQQKQQHRGEKWHAVWKEYTMQRC